MKLKIVNLIFLIYVKHLLNKWYIYAALVFFIIDVIVDVIYPGFNVPPYLIVIGVSSTLFYANYKVYKDLYESIPAEYQPEEPLVMLELIEGNSYEYSLDESGYLMKVHDGEMPGGTIEINGRIENKSSHIIQVTSLSGRFNDSYQDRFYKLMLPDAKVNDVKIQFPISIDPKSSLEFQYVSSMHPSNYTEAQIAVRTSKQDSMNVEFRARVDYIYGDNKEDYKEAEFNISLKPFAKKLIEYWQKNDKKEILKLAKSIK